MLPTRWIGRSSGQSFQSQMRTRLIVVQGINRLGIGASAPQAREDRLEGRDGLLPIEFLQVEHELEALLLFSN